MICENIEFHNIAEINGGVLYRIPLSVCDALATTEKGAIDAFPSRKAAEKKMEDYAK